MLTLIPLEYYTAVYYYFLLVIVFLVLLYTQLSAFDSRFESNRKFFKILGSVTFIFVIFYMGLRPISGYYFGDMSTYNKTFEDLKFFGVTTAIPKNDIIFYYYMFVTSKIMEAGGFFLLTTFIYTVPIFIVSKKIFGKYWFYLFLMFVTSFSFWAYGTNGLRNGLATSVFLLVYSYRRLSLRLLILLVACHIHSSMIIPTVAYIIALVIHRPILLFYGWILTIPLSLFSGGFFQSLFSGFFSDDRTSYLTEGNINGDDFSSTGFRWDFILYSAVAVLIGYYFIYKKHYQNRLYHLIYGTYLVANAFWILVIKANFSNRFAYLSWFIMPLVILYPLLEQPKTKHNHQLVGYAISLYFSFTLFMFIKSGA